MLKVADIAMVGRSTRGQEAIALADRACHTTNRSIGELWKEGNLFSCTDKGLLAERWGRSGKC